MTTLGPALIVPGTSEPAVHTGWKGLRFMMPNTLSSKVEFAHLFGTDFKTVFPTGQGPDKTIGDHSLSGRHLTNFGVTPGAKSFTAGSTAYYLSPLTLSELLALGAGKASMFAVCKMPNVNSTVMGTYNGGSVDGLAFGRLGGSFYYARTSYADAGKPDFTTPQIATDSDSGVVYELLGVTIDNVGLSEKLYRHKAGGTLQSGTQALTYPVQAASRIAFGRSFPGAQYTAACEIVAAFGFSDALGSGDVAVLQASLKTFLAGYSVTI